MHKRRADSDPELPDRLYTTLTSKQQRADLQERLRSDNKNKKEWQEHVTEEEEERNGTNMKGWRKGAERKGKSPHWKM